MLASRAQNYKGTSFSVRYAPRRSTPMAWNLRLPWVSFIYVLLITGVQARHCTNPSVRREWRALSREDRIDWISAVNCLARLPHDPALTPLLNLSVSLIPPVNTSSSFYDDITYVHMDLNNVIHYTGLFLPWHRAYVFGFEQALKKKCNYPGVQPYWDWTIDAPDFYHATILDPDPESGFGGWGDPANDYQITTGGFRDLPAPYPVPHRIRRNFTLQPFLGLTFPPDAPPPFSTTLMINTSFSKSNIDYMINSYVGDYGGFQGYFEGPGHGAHGGPHLILGLDMSGACPGNAGPDCVEGPKWTPSDPLFFMHHAMVDKVWYDWQKKNPKNFWSFDGGSVSAFNDPVQYAKYPSGAPPYLHFDSQLPSDGLLWYNKTILDYMDPLSDELCYTYE